MSLTLTVRPTLIDRVVPNSLASDIALVVGGAALTAVAAQMSIPTQPVPFTFQTLAVLLVGSALGSLRGSLSMLVYLLAGLALPIYADGASGPAALFGATGGYLIGFVIAAAVVGLLGEYPLTKNVFGMLASFVLGSAIIYTLGVLVLAATVFSWNIAQAAEVGVYPFLVWDAVKALIAAGLVPAAWRLTQLIRR